PYSFSSACRYDEGRGRPSYGSERDMVWYDVLIIGTRCAGAPLAMLLARKGYKVLGVDRARFPSDTVSTHFMWPRTTSSLQRWGLLDRLGGARAAADHQAH